MRVFMCEFVTGGGLRGEPIASSLAREGRMMRDALARDLSDIPDVSLVTTHDDRLPPPPVAASVAVDANRDPWRLWSFCARHSDVAWAVAPETGGVLERLVSLCAEAGATVVGPDCKTIALAASKLSTAERLIACGVSAAPVWTPDAVPDDEAGPFVTKPDDGAGCEATFLLDGRPSPQSVAPGSVVQRFVAGDAASLTALRAYGRTTLLAANRQHVAVCDRTFRFSGVEVGALDDADGRLAGLAHAVGRALPGLDGIFGIDVVLGADGPVVIEVNPRLTTAYAGLREAIGANPAALVAPFADTVPAAIARGRKSVEVVL